MESNAGFYDSQGRGRQVFQDLASFVFFADFGRHHIEVWYACGAWQVNERWSLRSA